MGLARWNSMLHDTKNCEKFLIIILAQVRKPNIENLNAGKITMLKMISMCLNPFEEATVKVSGENYVTVSLCMIQ